MKGLIKRIFFNNTPIKTFFISRLSCDEIQEQVFLKSGNDVIEITHQHGMICLDPFCLAAWLPADQAGIGEGNVTIQFKKGNKLNASITVSLIETVPTENGALLLYKIEKVKNYQLNYLHRLVFFGWLLKAQKNTYQSRRVISALYSYPRSIIIVSYKDNNYCNIFPMDIHSCIEVEGLYLLGLRTTNITLNKILEAKKVVVCDTDAVDINTVYTLGKQPSASPIPLDELPFGTTESEQFGFPIPDFSGSYKELEIIHHRKMGFHMLMVGRIVNQKQVKTNPLPFYHIGFLQFQQGNYKSIEAVY